VKDKITMVVERAVQQRAWLIAVGVVVGGDSGAIFVSWSACFKFSKW